MKKIFNTLTLLLWVITSQAQTEFHTQDSLARSIKKNKFPTPDALAKVLCKDLKNDRDKARVLFTWVAENIRYDFDAMGKEGPEASSKKEYEDKMVKQVYTKGKGVCMHYALLYKRMADAVGLECAFITGNSKGSVRGGWASHAWNAVNIEGEWKLLDATWGAGYFDVDDGKFVQVFQPGFFFTPPRIFALDHFPDDEKWQLLETPMDKTTFKKQCAFSYGDPLLGIMDAEPFGLPLAKGTDGKMELRLKAAQPPSVIQLRMGGREIAFEQSVKDGWITLRFSPAQGRELQVWSGKKTRKVISTTLMGIFPVK